MSGHRREDRIKTYRRRLLLSVAIVWSLVFLLQGNYLATLIDYGYFFLLGLGGAIVANSTGAGGGIIFIPFFNALGIDAIHSVGTSILIQSFGMTAGAISWLTTSHIVQINSSHLNRLMVQLLVICGISSIVGILSGQYFLEIAEPDLMLRIFKGFSVIFGFVLLGIVFLKRKQSHTRFDLCRIDRYFFAITCCIGGVVTAWISVGIGEIIALALILRHYPTMVAIATGVAMSSVSVLTAAYHHIAVIDSPEYGVLLFAAPGALIGGTFAYLLSEWLGPRRLKVFFSIWIIATGLGM
jgi:uncharacterized membrane protein YfcA